MYNADHAFEEVQNNKTHIKTNINSYETPIQSISWIYITEDTFMEVQPPKNVSDQWKAFSMISNRELALANASHHF